MLSCLDIRDELVGFLVKLKQLLQKINKKHVCAVCSSFSYSY